MEVLRRGHNLRSIQTTKQDSEGSDICGSEEATYAQSTYIHPSAYTMRVVMMELIPLLMLVTVPFSVHAGVFTSLLSKLHEDTLFVEQPVTTSGVFDITLLSAGVNPDPLAALGGGDVIVEEGALVSGGPFGTDTYADDSLSSGEISVYVVREGDALSQIAEMFDVTTNTILWANDISKASSIRPGDTLVILPIVGVRHVVKKGDTIGTIAKKYKGDTKEILSYNQLSSADELSVGATLVIPGGNMESARPKKVARSTAPSSSVRSTTVQSGAGLIHPLPGAVRTQGIHGYNAVDLAAPVGTPIRAAADGEVIISRSSGWNGGYGKYVVVKHSNGSQTLYAHMSSNTVGVGAYVNAGQTIGYVGITGRSTGPHLHFEVRGDRNPF